VLLILIASCATLYVFTTFTSPGRIASLYVVGGIQAPLAIQSSCIKETNLRVREKFAVPLAMDPDARQALKEYWYYSFFRECLYTKGYSFLGKPLPASRLSSSSAGVTYMNPIAGISLTVASDTAILKDNELDVEYDYRLLQSTLVADNAPLIIDTYTNHEEIIDFETLVHNFRLLIPHEVVITSSSTSRTPGGIRYLVAHRSDEVCGVAFVSPHGRVIHIYTSCNQEASTLELAQGITILPKVVSIH